MRCKVGDLAVLVRVNPGLEQNLGKLFHVERKGRVWDWVIRPLCSISMTRSYDGEIVGYSHYIDLECMDNQLRPIRDNDGIDEMVRMAGKDESVLAECDRLIEEFNRLADAGKGNIN